MRNDTVIVEHTYDAPIARVWQALTDPAQMKQWYFDVPEFRAEVGCEFSFRAGKDGTKWLHLCKVTEVIPGTSISYTWRYDEEPGNSVVTFELTEEGGKTKLTITHVGLSSFPDMDSFRAANFTEGWTYFATKALPGFLAKE